MTPCTICGKPATIWFDMHTAAVPVGAFPSNMTPYCADHSPLQGALFVPAGSHTRCKECGAVNAAESIITQPSDIPPAFSPSPLHRAAGLA